MPWATLSSPALGYLRAATSNINLYLGLSCGIVNDNHSETKITYTT